MWVIISNHGDSITKFSCDWKPATGQPNNEMNDEFCYSYNDQNNFWILIGQWHMHIQGVEYMYKTEYYGRVQHEHLYI